MHEHTLFPPKILNLRLRTGIEQFFEDYSHYCRRQGWPTKKPSLVDELKLHFRHPQFEVRVQKFYPDGAAHVLQYYVKGVPGVQKVTEATIEEIEQGKGTMVMVDKHSFRIELPREYPNLLSKIRVFNESEMFHPRFGKTVQTEVCIAVNGEIDRILLDLVFQILQDPERVRPPSMYDDGDFGVNYSAMLWYQKRGPKEIHQILFQKFVEQWGKQPEPKKPKKGGLQILD